MDFAREHRLFDEDEPDDRPDGVHCLTFFNGTDETIILGGPTGDVIPGTSIKVCIAGTDTPLEIIPGCGPPPPEFRTMMVDGAPTLVLVEMGCASPGDAGVFGLCGESRAPRPCYRSVWDVYGLRRRPRTSRGRRR